MTRTPAAAGVPRSPALLFVILGLLLFAPIASGQWYNSSWTKRKAITVNSGQVPSTQSNFPMLVSLASDSDLAANALANGYDILFTDSSGTTKLSYQRELYNSSTGQLIAWVNVPSLANGTVIYMYFGNSSETTDQQSATGTWNGNYGMVLHLANGSAGTAPDSSANGNNAANTGLTAITGEIGGAATSPGGQTEGLYIASPTTNIQTTGPLTYSMWVNPNALQNPQGEEQYLINGAAAFWLNTDGTLQGWLGTSGSYVVAQSTNTLATGAWSYVVFTFDGVVGDLPHIYLNGSEVSYNTQGGGSGSLGSFSGPMAIGEAASNVYAYNLKGGLDEARIATTNLSANWIQTEYNNQSAPSTFFAEGSVQNSQAATPTFTPAAGTYSSTQTVTIGTTTSGASIRYTTDGSTPSETHGTVYSSAISVSSSMTVMAIAYGSGLTDSSVASAQYTINSGTSWYNSSWTKRKAITVNSGQVPSTQSNFPMLVSLASDSDLAGNALANGYDILFTDSSGTTKLSYQRELYNSSTGQLIAWVNVPSLANGTVIYMYFGNSSETTDQQNATGAWNSNYGMVLHLANGSASPAPDSTANGNNAANTGLTAITGEIGGAATSPGATTEGLYIASPTTSIQTTGPLTYSMWVNPSALQNPQGEEQYLINGSAAFWLNTNGTLQGWLGTSGSYVVAQSTNTLATGAWSYVVFAFGGAVGDLPHIYLNGSEVSYTTQGGGSGSLGSFSGPMAIGEAASNVYAYNLKGGLDEARIATTNLSANWIQTEYNNQSAPSTFFTEGSVQNSGGGSSPVATPTFSPASGTYSSTQTVTISTTTSGATIRYTTDGSTPSETHGTVYSSAVSVTTTTTINAIAYESGYTDSSVASAAYTIGGGEVAAPTFSPAGGTYSSAQTVTISTTTSGATIRYTTDGSTPSETAGAVYGSPITVGATTTINAIAYKSGMTDSSVVSAPYTINSGGGGLNYVTTYTYDLLNHLTKVSMPRSTGTQTRTFVYNGNNLTSATNPENGTVSYTYNSYGKVATRTDAKGQQVVYSYDFYARLTEVQRYPTPGAEDVCQREVYYYDGNNPLGSGYPQNALGRLSAVQYWGGYNPTSSPTCDTTFTEMYTYGIPGAPVGKQLTVTRTLQWPSENNAVTKNVTLIATFTYDNEGRMTAETYPTDNNGNTASLSYTFDNMGRLNTMTDVLNGVPLITGASYGPANEMLSLTGGTYNGAWGSETHTYNSLKQLTQLSSNGLSIQYNYPSTGNNGKIASQTDLVSGETVTYSYDALNRLATAATQSNISVPWGQSFTYDGFGNLTNVGVTQGSTPTLTASYDGNNHAGGEDANGNPSSIPAPAYGANVAATYDVENRLVSGAARYSYAPDNKRVWRGAGGWNSDTGQWSPTDEVTFWSVSGQKLATYQLTTSLGVGPPSPSQPAFYATQTATNYYFGSKLIKDNNGWVYSDRLGSIGKFYPYGIERPSATSNGTEKFTGYFRDSETGNDYAVNRYMSPGNGRFITPDPTMAGVDYSDPGTWNAYAYVNGDPINLTDPSGLIACGDLPVAGGGTVSSYVTGDGAQSNFIDLVWHEGGFLSSFGGNTALWQTEFYFIAQAIWDRYLIVTGQASVVGANGTTYSGQSASILGYGYVNSPTSNALDNVLIAADGGAGVVNPQTGQLVDNASALQSDLSQDQGNLQYQPGLIETSLVSGQDIWVTQQCYSVISAMQAGNSAAAGINQNPSGTLITSWGVNGYVSPNYKVGIESSFGNVGPTNFWGFGSVTYGNFGPVVRRPKAPGKKRTSPIIRQ